MKKQRVLLLATGGTIEKSYSESDGTIDNRHSVYNEKLLTKLRLPHTEIEAKRIMNKDSLHMTEPDRELIWQEMENGIRQGLPVLILHGTDTLENTMLHCFKRNPTPSQPVVFTGAMKPAGFDDSDALQNFTEALFATQFALPGYYVAFHGSLIRGPYVRKNREKGTFEIVE